jgi:cytidylate kinase
MEDLLYKYMTQRYSEANSDIFGNSNGPVLTISRSAGCSTTHLVNELISKLNEISKDHKWEVISKDILRQSAEELKMHPDKLKKIFETKNRSIFDEVVQAFISGDYQLEKRMIKTVVNVIHGFGLKGHKIIVGRAANIICSDISKSLHVKIDAPLQWKIEKVEKNKGFSKEEAINYINQTDKNREYFRKSIKSDYETINLWDLTINQAAFSTNEIVTIIIAAMKMKNVI